MKTNKFPSPYGEDKGFILCPQSLGGQALQRRFAAQTAAGAFGPSEGICLSVMITHFHHKSTKKTYFHFILYLRRKITQFPWYRPPSRTACSGISYT